MVPRALGPLLCLLATGCSWLLPLESAGRDASVEAATPLDAAPHESAILVPDALTCPDGGCCVEADPLTNPHCTQPCGGGDCDGLPDSRDPWPQVCNRALLAEPFFEPKLPWFVRSYDKGYIHTECGALVFPTPEDFTLWAWVKGSLGLLVSPQDLVEVRLSWVPMRHGAVTVQVPGNGAPGDTAYYPWGFGPANGRSCRLMRTAWGTWDLINAIAEQSTRSTEVALSDPADIVIQSYVADGAHQCRIASGSQAPSLVKEPLPAFPPLTGTSVLIEVINLSEDSPAEILLDYVRVFAGP